MCISENVDDLKYTKNDLSDQDSATCLVQMKCIGQGEAAKAKAVRIFDNWRQQYKVSKRQTGIMEFSEKKYNRYNCVYNFLVQL